MDKGETRNLLGSLGKVLSDLVSKDRVKPKSRRCDDKYFFNKAIFLACKACLHELVKGHKRFET